MDQGARDRGAQLARALVLAVVATSASSVAHVLAGGHAPAGAGFTVVVGVLAVLSLPLVTGTLTLLRATGLLSVLQVLAHVGNELAAAAGRGLTSTREVEAAAVLLARHGHGARGADIGAGLGTGPLGDSGLHSAASSMAHGGLVPSTSMLLAHTAVAIALAAVFAHGQRSWAVAVRLLRDGSTRAVSVLVAALSSPARVLPAATPRALLAGASLPRANPPRDVWSAPSPARRGPPVGLL